MAKKWYVIHTYSGYENKVQAALLHRVETLGMEDSIFKIEIPTETVINREDGKEQEKKIYPGYILVQMEMSDNSWYVVRNTPGVTGFIGSRNKPIPLTREEYSAMMRKTEAKTPQTVTNYAVGQTVRIKDGAFTDFDATITEINVDKGTMRVNVTLFGRETPVELEFYSVEPI
ncbi:MAG: transcription termination/antitermination protein NusG [Actinomycetes bacterium]|jgi:transcriptional antiterminator NusG|nr:transcription termination/antitermination protein NusG [Actinomycetes bacterium]